MPAITPAQIRGACGMLNWSRLDLARAARLSVSVVMSATGRNPGRVSADSLAAIRAALEIKGVEFMSVDGGVALRLREQQPSVFFRLK